MELNKIYNEDCLEVMKRLPDNCINLMLTDIPYGVTSCDWDIKPNLTEMWVHWERIVKQNGAFIFTATQPFTTELVTSKSNWFKYELIWDKKMTSTPALAKIQPLRSHENILIFYRQQPTYNPIMRTDVLVPFGKRTRTSSDVVGNLGSDYQVGVGYPKSILEFPRPNNLTDGGLHPSQKPIDLFRWLIQTYSNEGETVFDGYMGSGTTAMACIQEKRNYIGAELNKEYFEGAIKRIETLIAKPELF